MAILPTCRGLRVEVATGPRSVLKEYDDDSREFPPPNTVIKYLQLNSKLNFQVKFYFSDGFKSTHGVMAEVHLDGIKMQDLILRPKQVKQFDKKGHCIDAALFNEKGKSFERKFKFSKLAVEADSGGLPNKKLQDSISSIGVIEVKFFYVKHIKIDKGSSGQPLRTISSKGAVPEKVVGANALSHRSGLGAKKQHHNKLQTLNRDLVDGDSNPFAHFIFKYRSLESLQDLHIAPRSPDPAPYSALMQGPTPSVTPTPAPWHGLTPTPAPAAVNFGKQYTGIGGGSNLSFEELKILLNSYTGNTDPNRWKNVTKDEAESLLEFHRAQNAKAATVKVKRERANDIKLEDDADDPVVVEERSVKRKCFPKEGQDVMKLE